MLVSTALMVVIPGETLYCRAARLFGSKRDWMSNDEALCEDPPEREGQMANYCMTVTSSTLSLVSTALTWSSLRPTLYYHQSTVQETGAT